MTIKSILQRQKSLYPVFLKHAVCTKEALKYMLDYKLLQVPVFDKSLFVGLVNRRKLTRLLMKHRHGPTLPDEVLRRDVMIVSPYDDLGNLARTMPHDQHIIPVIDNEKYLTSLTRNEIYSALLTEREDRIMDYERYIRSFGIVG